MLRRGFNVEFSEIILGLAVMVSETGWGMYYTHESPHKDRSAMFMCVCRWYLSMFGLFYCQSIPYFYFLSILTTYKTPF